MRDVGYEYVVLDDCLEDGRGEDGYIRVDKQKFPNGMKWVAGQLHDQGLLYGMYSSAGELTCARYEGFLELEKENAQSFVSWDVDYLKYDSCYHMGRFGSRGVFQAIQGHGGLPQSDRPFHSLRPVQLGRGLSSHLGHEHCQLTVNQR